MEEHFNLLLESKLKIANLQDELEKLNLDVKAKNKNLNELSISNIKVQEKIGILQKKPQETLINKILGSIPIILFILSILISYILFKLALDVSLPLLIMGGITIVSTGIAVVIVKIVKLYFKKYRLTKISEITKLEEELDLIRSEISKVVPEIYLLDNKRREIEALLEKEKKYNTKIKELLLAKYGPYLDLLIKKELEQDNPEIKEVYEDVNRSLTLEL